VAYFFSGDPNKGYLLQSAIQVELDDENHVKGDAAKNARIYRIQQSRSANGNNDVSVKSIGKLSEPEPPHGLSEPKLDLSFTGRVSFQRKAAPTGRVYPSDVPLTCYALVRGAFLKADHVKLCSTTTDKDGFFKCEQSALDPYTGGEFYCQFEAVSGVTMRYRTPGIKGTSGLGDVTLYPDRRNLPGCSKNKCGAADPKYSGPILKALGLPMDGDPEVPDCWFGDICDNHDCCYSECGVSQELCDDEFRALADSVCRIGDVKHTPYVIPNPLKSFTPSDVCFVFGGCNEATTSAYYEALKALGGEGFAAAQATCLDEHAKPSGMST
jgi:hypothetical protein